MKSVTSEFRLAWTDFKVAEPISISLILQRPGAAGAI